jgi:hypothetical protein
LRWRQSSELGTLRLRGRARCMRNITADFVLMHIGFGSRHRIAEVGDSLFERRQLGVPRLHLA